MHLYVNFMEENILKKDNAREPDNLALVMLLQLWV